MTFSLKTYTHSQLPKAEPRSRFDVIESDPGDSEEDENALGLRLAEEEDAMLDDLEDEIMGSHKNRAPPKQTKRARIPRNSTVGKPGKEQAPYDGSAHYLHYNRRMLEVFQSVYDTTGTHPRVLSRFYRERWSRFALTPRALAPDPALDPRITCLDNQYTLSAALANAVLSIGHLDVTKYTNEQKLSIKVPLPAKTKKARHPQVATVLNGANGEVTGSDDHAVRANPPVGVRAKKVVFHSQIVQNPFAGAPITVDPFYTFAYTFNGSNNLCSLPAYALCSDLFQTICNQVGVAVGDLRILMDGERFPNTEEPIEDVEPDVPLDEVIPLQVAVQTEGGGGGKKKPTVKNLLNMMNRTQNQANRGVNNAARKARKGVSQVRKRVNRVARDVTSGAHAIADHAEAQLHSAVDVVVKTMDRSIPLIGGVFPPNEASQKVRAFSEFTMTTGTAGSGFAAFNPCVVNDANTCIYSSNAATYAGTTINNLNSGSVGTTYVALTNLPYATAALVVPALQARVLGYGVTATCTTAPLYAQGVVQWLHHPTNQSIGTYAYSNMAAMTETVRKAVEPGMTFSFTIPPTAELQTSYAATTTIPFNTSASASVAGILVTGATVANPVTFLVEIVEIVEYVGSTCQSGSTPNPVYPTGAQDHMMAMGQLANRLRVKHHRKHHSEISHMIHGTLHGLRRTGHLIGKAAGVKTNKNESFAALGLAALAI